MILSREQLNFRWDNLTAELLGDLLDTAIAYHDICRTVLLQADDDNCGACARIVDAIV